MGYGWQGEKVRLVPLDKQRHLENYLRWFNDPEVTTWLHLGDFPMGRLAEEEFFDRVSKGDDKMAVYAIETLDGTHIGGSGIHEIDWRNGVGVTGTVIGSTEHWSQGFGTDAARVRLRCAFEVLGLRMLLSNVMAGNERSHRMLLRVGYEECGRIPQRWWKRGAYRDQIMLSVTRERWVSLPDQR